MNAHDNAVRAGFARHGLTYNGQRPHGYDASGRRSHGTCDRCGHTGTSCKCKPHEFWLWWLEQRDARRVQMNGPNLLRALKDLVEQVHTYANSDDCDLPDTYEALEAIEQAEGQKADQADHEKTA